MGYPGLTIDPEGEKIQGYLFSSDNLTQHWSELDDFEGNAYERLLINMTLKNGTTVKAYIYAIKRINNR